MRRSPRVPWALLVLAVVSVVCEAEAGSPFDAGRAWRDLERIVGFGPRPSGSAALERTRGYVVEELKKVGIPTRRQSFVTRTALGLVRMTNVVAEIPGRRSEVVVIGGHYDTKYFPGFRFVGANDGGSSTAVLLELARSVAGSLREYTVWIVFFDGEEERSPDSNRGALHGSRHLVRELLKNGDLRRVRATIVIDMIGDRDLDIRRDAGSARWLNDILWNTAGRLGYQQHFLEEQTLIEDDHVPFLQAGVPAALLIDYTYGRGDGGGGFWHTAKDTLDKLSPRSLQVVGEVLRNALPAIEAALTPDRHSSPR